MTRRLQYLANQDLQTLIKKHRLVVAGAISGTSCDGVSVAILEVVRLEEERDRLTATLLAHADTPYPDTLREELLCASELPVPELAGLHVRLGRRFAEAICRTAAPENATLDLVGCHGHTLFHRSGPRDGEPPPVSWQIGEAAELAAICGCPVVGDFRPADVARGGEGAPLVPFGDAILFRGAPGPRACLNLGGIANLTILDASGRPVLAFDCGPGNALLDLAVRRRTGERFDDGGRLAAKGKVHAKIFSRMLEHFYFAAKPPKSTGRELFGEAFLNEFVPGWEKTSSLSLEDLLATLTELTVQTVRRALAFSPLAPLDVVVAGGGARNRNLLSRLETLLQPVPLLSSEELGWPVDSREAACFALLAAAFIWGIPATIPSLTQDGAAAILGKLSLPPRRERLSDQNAI